jgi:cytidine deaminase
MLTDDLRQTLIQKAVEARDWAYAPYSGYAVGAAVLTESGKIYDGVNVENAVYPLTLCAERVAIFKAVSQGETSFQAIAVATKNGGSPCGSCRQVMAEFGMDLTILLADSTGKLVAEYTLSELLPEAFSDADLRQT